MPTTAEQDFIVLSAFELVTKQDITNRMLRTWSVLES
jgi:hypothetical protein